MLGVEGISVKFGGLHALDSVSLDVSADAITGLIGPNGAGKTTLFNVITGLQRPAQGRVFFGGQDVTRVPARRRSALGLGRTFQRLELFGSLTVHDNVLVAIEGRGIRGRAARQRSKELLERVGLDSVASTTASVLSTGLARQLELARALACQPKVLLLDEPSSGLDGSESGRLGELLKGLAGSGIAILLVEHDMEFVMDLCQRIYVLNFGRLIASGQPHDIQADPQVQAAYLGRPADADGSS
jgi:branched-chain amino acid transport system ATP-binding protein